MRITAYAAFLVLLASSCSDSPGPGTDTTVDTVTDLVEVDTLTDAPDTMDAPDTSEATDTATDDGFTDTIGMVCSNDEECQNGRYCDGVEHCPFGFCQAGPLVDCSDGVNCTVDACNEETDSCDHEVDDSACDDSNPCTTDSCEVSTDTCINEQIDCSELKHADSTALALLLGGAGTARESKRSVQITGLSSRLQSLAQVYGVEELLGLA